jgi:hypothetical protein
MHLTPEMTFETVQRLNHNLGVSLRQAVAKPLTSSVVSRQPSGVFNPSSGVLPRDQVPRIDFDRLSAP